MTTTTYRGHTYQVEPRNRSHIPYYLIGPRGARIALMRRYNQRDSLFPVNVRTGAVMPGWFRERDGVLTEERPMSR